MKFYLDAEKTKSVDRIYKYSPINENLYSSLINGQLWFSDPFKFNDPYDCNLDYDHSQNSYENIYNYLKEKFSGRVSEEDLQKRAHYLFNNPTYTKAIGKKILTDTIENRGIACFSECDDILLMWSHYANGHKGVCLTFEIEKDTEFFKLPYKVDYPNNYPLINPFDNNNHKEVQMILATKSQEWAYEKEVRVIKEKGQHPKFRELIKFNKEALIEIKFGYKTSNKQIERIKKFVSTSYPHLKIYKATLKNKQFGIEFIPIDNS